MEPTQPHLYKVRITSGRYAGQYIGQGLAHPDLKEAKPFERATAERVQVELRKQGIESELLPLA
jgi:hypothetical protein